ncbi:MAG: CDP-diacylglycerol--glycerol-3-phosphate 3-phosphatidyltransferase [Ruminococcaceae bacterium]|nr:CDP-diacylglycerol--glycerol-3-phosphate 3-phosphatidyltransferase [Oscillospiraceae bacterium]
MNLPNKLSLMRVIMVPLFVAVIVLPETILPTTWSCILGAAIFILTAFTDFLDGMIARKFNMITDFGKFIDPLADKFMVFGAMLSILYKFESLRPVFIWAALIVIFRELAITSMRLIVSSNAGVVVAAAWLGKVKTVTQIICIVTILLEPVIIPESSPLYGTNLLSYITIAAMTVMTLWSGIDYMKAYWKYLDPTK